MSGVNYFFYLTTIISPYQRQLLLDSLAGRGAPGKRAETFCSRCAKIVLGGEGRRADHTFFFSHPFRLLLPSVLLSVGRRDPERSEGDRSPTDSKTGARSASLSRGLGFHLLIHLGVLHPITRDVQFNNHAVVHQSVNGGRRHHGIFEDCFPF